jgi:hypothetical protein
MSTSSRVFASAEGKSGGQFYTPSRVVRVLVETLAPYKGRVYDPCCGSIRTLSVLHDTLLPRLISGELRIPDAERWRHTRACDRLHVTRNRGAAMPTTRRVKSERKAKSSRKVSRKTTSSREKVQAHRQRLREQGLRPIQIWVPDVRSPEFAREARRQSRLIAQSPHEADDQAFVNAISEWNDE